MEITLQHSILWLLLALPVLAAFVWWIYRPSKAQDSIGRLPRMALRALRFVLLASMVFILLEPFFVLLTNEEEKPKLVVVDDVSASIAEEEVGRARALMEQHRETLEAKYDIRYLSLGGTLLAETDSSAEDVYYTDYQTLVEGINERYYNQNIGAVVLSTDGIQTRGADPRYLRFNHSAPLHVLAMGDSTAIPDVELSEALANRYAFVGNDMEIKVRMRSTAMAGERVKAVLMQGDKILSELSISVKSASSAHELVFRTPAERPGMNRYRIILNSGVTEKNTINNSAEVFVEVLDNRTRILILAKAPHPDIAAMRSAIESSDQYEVEVALIRDWDMNLAQTDLVVLHALPADVQDLNKISIIGTKKIPVLAVVTPTVSVLHFNELGLGVAFDNVRGKADQAGASHNQNFNLFNLEPIENLDRFPPLSVPFGDMKRSGETQVYLHQRIGSVVTERPMVMFSESTGWKRALILGEGWWRWRLYARMQLDSDWPDLVLQKTVQYLALKQKRSRLNVVAPQRVEESREVRFEAEYYNTSYELNTDAEVKLSLSDSAGVEFNYAFLPKGNGYALNIGTLAPGTYTWKAAAQAGGERFTESGEFIVSKNLAEFVNLRANFNMLERWVEPTQGRVHYKGGEDALIQNLLNQPSALPIIHTYREWSSIIEWKWMVFIIALLATAEWIVRKYHGLV